MGGGEGRKEGERQWLSAAMAWAGWRPHTTSGARALWARRRRRLRSPNPNPNASACAAQVIRELLDVKKFVIVVEHDLSVLDYLSDFICCLYGKPGAYGVVTLPFGVRCGRRLRGSDRLALRRGGGRRRGHAALRRQVWAALLLSVRCGAVPGEYARGGGRVATLPCGADGSAIVTRRGLSCVRCVCAGAQGGHQHLPGRLRADGEPAVPR